MIVTMVCRKRGAIGAFTVREFTVVLKPGEDAFAAWQATYSDEWEPYRVLSANELPPEEKRKQK